MPWVPCKESEVGMTARVESSSWRALAAVLAAAACGGGGGGGPPSGSGGPWLPFSGWGRGEVHAVDGPGIGGPGDGPRQARGRDPDPATGALSGWLVLDTSFVRTDPSFANPVVVLAGVGAAALVAGTPSQMLLRVHSSGTVRVQPPLPDEQQGRVHGEHLGNTLAGRGGQGGCRHGGSTCARGSAALGNVADADRRAGRQALLQQRGGQWGPGGAGLRRVRNERDRAGRRRVAGLHWWWGW